MNIDCPADSSAFIQSGRDLRLDFLRGLIMLLVVLIHLSYLSLLSMFAWERIGFVSSAEGFVFLSGTVLGLVSEKRMSTETWFSTARRLWRRSVQLYLAYLVIIFSIVVFRMIPGIETFDVTHWIDFSTGLVYPVFPDPDLPWSTFMERALLLRMGPHQFQIIGLYILLIAFSPVILFLIRQGKTLWALVLIWTIFTLDDFCHFNVTHAQFEYAFPLLTWQALFFTGIAMGYHRKTIFSFITAPKQQWLYSLAWLIALGLFFLAMSNTNALFWPGPTFSLIDPQAYTEMYVRWFDKTWLGVGRVINNAALFIILFNALTYHWPKFNKLLGWFLIPIGQASLYVFILHIYFIVLISSTPLPGYENILINTGIHLFTLIMIWWMVKNQFLFKIIPR
jgi:hypothetical protein